MIKKLKQRFILIAMLSISIVLVLLISFIDILSYADMVKTLDVRLEILSENEGTFPNNGGGEMKKPDKKLFEPFPDRLSGETPYNTRFFTVKLDSDGNVIFVNTGRVATVTTNQASYYAERIYETGKLKGFYGDYRFKVVGDKDQKSSLYIFVNCEQEIRTFKMLILVSFFVLFVGVLLVYLLVRVLTNIAIKPVAESYEKQKRFITDASHEIKTPLAIIDANTEVIEIEAGESDWTRSTRSQIKRLSNLTEKLIFLSRMDEEDREIQMMDFDIGELLDETVSSYEGLLKQRTLETNIQTNINYHGNYDNMLQIFGLLMDNAIKYSNMDGAIKVTCNKKGKNIYIEFYNTVDNIQKGNLDILFERFYRNDSSRNSKTGGYGIGLSVVKAVVEAHKGSIHSESSDGKSITFNICL